MARPSVSLSRPVRRIALTSALVIGGFITFTPSAHASPPPFTIGSPLCTNPATGGVQPATLANPSDSVTATSGATVNGFTSGTITVTVDGASASFTANGTNRPAFQQIGTLTPVQSGGCDETALDPASVSFQGSFVGPNNSTCVFTLGKGSTEFSVDQYGNDTLRVGVQCNDGSGMNLTLEGTGSAEASGHTPTSATPELGSGELLATGLVPALGIVLYRRRRQRRASK